jgi:MFS family permease
MVACVYAAAGFMQLIGGQLADRHALKNVYVGALLVQVPLLAAAAASEGLALMLVAILMVSANAAALPAENMLLARYTPANRHGLAFGAKFVLAFGAAPLAVQLVSFVQGRTGEFHVLFIALSAFSLIALVAALLLPRAEPAVAQTA